MAPEPERPASDEDTAALDDDVRAASDEAWPVSDLYYVDPNDGVAAASGPSEETFATTVVASQDTAPAARRFPPNPTVGALLALVGVAGALLLVAVLLGGDDDPAATAQTPTRPAATTPPAETTTAAVAAKVDVANVEGMSLAEARAALQEQGLTVRVTRSQSERPRGEVLNQEPPVGSNIAEGTVVALVVSRGEGGSPAPAPATVTVPGVIGLSASDAVSVIRDAGLEARVRQVALQERRGTVIDQAPEEGAEVAQDSTVQLEVAKPPAVTVQRVDVPDVVGSTASAARSELRAAGLTVATVAIVSQEPPGTVVSQMPRAGAEVREGARVRLTVSSGPAEVAVPDVTGLDEAAARQELEAAGFEVRVTDESITDPAEDGLVLRQTPPAASSAQEGAVVVLVVGRLR